MKIPRMMDFIERSGSLMSSCGWRISGADQETIQIPSLTNYFSISKYLSLQSNARFPRYENDNPAAKFSEQQLSEIRKVTLSKVLCDNYDVPTEMQRAAFDLPSNFL